MSFHDVRFPVNLSFGSVGGPERLTDIVTLANGFEERNSPWAHSRRHYDAGVAMRSVDDIGAVVAFFEARHGQIYGFRWKDWADYKSCVPSKNPSYTDQLIAMGDDVTQDFQLVKNYRSGHHSYQRPISKPVEDSVSIGLSDELQAEGQHFSVDYSTGMVHFFHPPNDGVEITAGYEFDVPVRFDTDRIQISISSFEAGEVPNVPVIEVRV